MEGLGSAVLTPQQKEQLKEKLAVLKREYNRTFHRLQRAERAARVKNDIKETVAEQNLLLGQEEAVKNHAGNLSQLSPEEGQAGISCPGSTAETTPVLFKSGACEGSLPETSDSRRAHQPSRRVLFDSAEPPLARNSSLHSTGGRGREQREGPSLATWGETAWEAHRREPERATEQGWESPGFRRSSSLLDPGQRSPPKSSLRASPGGSGDVTPAMSDRGSELGRRMQTDVPAATQELPCSLPQASQGSCHEPPSQQEGVSGLGDLAAGSRSFWASVRSEEQPGQGCEEGAGSLPVTPDAARGGRAVADWLRDDGEPPRRETSREDEGHSLEAGSAPLGGVTPSEEGLSSCTVVEGLMFPLEYYVRVTRRLSRRQKEVNLEAVVQSQLGKGRKGRRGPHKGQGGNPAQPPQELPKRDDRPSSTPRMRGDASGSPPRSPESGGSGQGRRGRRLRRRTQQRTSFSTGSPPASSPGLASPALWMVEDSPAPAALPLTPLVGQGSRLSWLPPGLLPQEFHLPEEDFGHLKSKKLKVCPEKPLGAWDAGGSSKSPPRPPGEAPLEEGAALGQTLLSGMSGGSSALSSRELLLSPALEAGQSLLQTPNFPLVGATPAPLQSSPGAPGASLTQAAVAASSDPGRGIGWPCSPAGIGRKAQEEAASPSQKPLERDKEPPRQSGPAKEVQVEAPADTLREGHLKMTSKVKNGSGSCLVDMSAVWWEGTDFAELCMVTAEEASISLWRPLEPGQWGTVHTWHFTKLPVLQIVPLSGAHSVVCAVLGRLETAEIRLLFGCAEEELLKAGNINAVLGLADRKLVSSCWSLQGQAVEVFSFSEVGRSHQRWALKPPEETVLAFADVAGLQEALLGMTAMNCIVLWNLGSGQLLKKIPVGWSFPASVCHKAYSDSGLLFLVFSHPHAKDSQLPGNPAFQIMALNPKTARSSGVMLLAPPPGVQGRYLERDVRGSSAAAVLTSGAIAVWDLFLGQCTALLPPNSGGSWSLVRWSVTDTCLLAGQEDGSVYLYRYSGGLHPG
ncbi:partner and localizer of BRCA2 [Pseudonaja textilis]|uniref:partner and localizer of BRCA2 n=1 Tax=Pseudonaja textilis TaxID=8673 RepID=UPI000EA9A48F|nr:partner and localizer of BRCA2 [Pseudonaja textilis]